MLGEDRLGMELHTFDRELAVAQPHHETVLGLGAHLEHVGYGVTLDDERVVSGRGERSGNVAEHALAVVRDLRRLAVHHLRRAHDLAAEELADALVTEAHAQHRHAGRAEHADRVVGDAGVLGVGAGIPRAG